MASPFRTPTEQYTTSENADLIALILASRSASVATEVAIYDALKADGNSTAIAAARANPTNTQKLITYNVVFTGTATKAAVATALHTYTNALAVAANVVAATATSAVTDLATVTSAQTFELSLDADPSGETSDLTIAALEVAYTETDTSIVTTQTVYADVHITGTAIEATIETIVSDYVATLAAGAVVDQSALSTLILADGDVTTVTVCEIGFAAAPDAEIDITLSAGNLGVATAASITFTDAG